MSGLRPLPLPKTLECPPRGNVLVIAPHPDDETMGMGGTLALHSDQGDAITALFVCNGIQGDPEGYYPRDQIVRVREQEARAAANILGIRELRFLGYPDNLSDADIHVFEGLPENPDEARLALAHGFSDQVAALLLSSEHTIVYYPWDQELNADHFVIGQAMTHLIHTHGDEFAHVSFLGYDVWSPCIPDTVLDITRVMDRKLKAVAAYESQNRYGDYAHPVSGLDAYRSILLPKGARFGEAFVGRYRECDT